jgi:hypothetical protein
MKPFNLSTFQPFNLSTFQPFNSIVSKCWKLTFFTLVLFIFLSVSDSFGQLTNTYNLTLTQECNGESEIGGPIQGVGVRVQPYDPQVGGPQKPAPTAPPTQLSDVNGKVSFSLACNNSAYAVYYRIGGAWTDYYSILEIDCTDGINPYFNMVKLPSNFRIESWGSCDAGTGFLPSQLFAIDVGCEQGLDIHIPNQFFSGSSKQIQTHEFILDVNRVNRNTGQMSDYTSFSFTATDNNAGKIAAASTNNEVYLVNCPNGTSHLYIDFAQIMENNSGSFECGQSLNLDVSLGVRCAQASRLPVWHEAWIEYTFNTLNSPIQFVFETRPSVDAQNGSPYQNGDPNDGILLNIDTDPNGSGQGPLLGNVSGGISVEVDNDQLDCIESVEVYLYEYESCSAVFDPDNGLVTPGSGLTNPIDITNQFTPTNSFADVQFSTDIIGGQLDQNTCYYVELVAESVCGSVFTTGGRFQTGSCSFCRIVKVAATSVKAYPTHFQQGENINLVFDKPTLSRGMIQVYDMNGILKTEETFPNHSKSYSMSTLHLNPGVYLLDIKVDGLHEGIKVVVQ